jgi:hypothetical protein
LVVTETQTVVFSELFAVGGLVLVGAGGDVTEGISTVGASDAVAVRVDVSVTSSVLV